MAEVKVGDVFRHDERGLMEFVSYATFGDGASVVVLRNRGTKGVWVFSLYEWENRFSPVDRPQENATQAAPAPGVNYINLALINIGEATAAIGNGLQRGAGPGDYGAAKLALQRAVFALDGLPYAPEK